MTELIWKLETYWNLDYKTYLEKMKFYKEESKKNNNFATLLICSHPHCFTNGRGLQRQSNGKISPELVTLSIEMENNLTYPLHQISRAGGLTFHYPGQVIVYPIVHIGKLSTSLLKFMYYLLKTAEKTIAEYSQELQFEIPKDNFGLWVKNKKIASIGMALDRDITEHGMAINLNSDFSMFAALSKIFPCGLSGNSYTCLQELIHHEINLEDFKEKFKSNLSYNFL